MIKKIIVILVILVAGTILFINSGPFETKRDNSIRDIPSFFLTSSSSDESAIKLELLSLVIPGSEAALSAEAWAIFQKYLEFAKKHNLSGIRSLSHQISATCNDPSKEKECFALMDSVYSLAGTLTLSDLKHIQVDERQIIMYTDGPVVAILYFIRDNGTIKVLGMRFCIENEKTVGTCVETDPTKRDLDGNGWWDGVESLFYRVSIDTQ